MLKFFRLPFAVSGDKTAVPDAVDVSGNVSYTQGYGFDYQRQKTDPAAKNIERDKMNQVFFDATNAIAELQAQGVPDFITSALNGGTAYSYGQWAVVKWTGDLYLSLVAANTALPSDAAKWALLPTPGRVRDGYNVVAASAGTADAITLALTPTQTAFAPGPTWWRAAAANATTTPTVKRDGLAAKTLVKGNNLPVVAGDIPGAGAWMVSQYDAALDKEVLLNPARGTVNFSHTTQLFTTGSGTYTTPAGVKALRVRMVGGGGGGSGSGSGAAAAGTGGTTSFGSSTATGGNPGVVNSTVGGAGGNGTISGGTGLALTGGYGTAGVSSSAANAYPCGGAGGASPFGGAGSGSGGSASGVGGAATANSGGGGGGAGCTVAGAFAGAGGGPGGYVDFIISAPAATYSYAIGAGGTSGGAGTNGFAGGAGASGVIYVEEIYV